MKQNLPEVFRVLLLFVCMSLGGPILAQTYANIAAPTRAVRVPLQNDSERRSLSRILFMLEDTYQVSFNYDDETVRTIYLSEDFTWDKKEKLEKVLSRLLQDVHLKFERLDKKNYLIFDTSKPAQPTNKKSVTGLTSQLNTREPASIRRKDEVTEINTLAFPISGVVKDETGGPLPGVNVIVKGSTTGTTTDANGAFKLEVPDGTAVLIVSFVGYAPQEIAVNNRTVIDVSLQPDITSLSEVVVMGYNTQDKKDVTGSVVMVKADELTSVPASNFAQQLQGRAAGVTVSNDNSPGGGVAVRIRGIGSVTGNNDPLYVIDGVPTQGGLNSLSPNDIETMQVLKDASAASIYGARANNGVIVITTKKGKSGVTKVNYSMYEGIQLPGDGPKQLNSQQLVDIIWADYKSRGLIDPATGNLTVADRRFGGGPTGVIPDYILSNGKGVNAGDPLIGNDPLAHYTPDYKDPDFNASKFIIYQPSKTGYNWYKEIYKAAPIRNHNISVTGGSDQGRFAISADYFQQNGILINNSFKRYSLRANTEFKIKNVIRVGENFQLSYTDGVGVSLRNAFSPIGGYLTSPYIVPYDIGGHYVGERVGEDHALSTLTRGKDNHGYTTRIFGNVYAEAELFRHVTARTSVGIDYTVYDAQSFSAASPESDIKSQVDALTFDWNKQGNITWSNTLNYQQEFGDHSFQFLVGTESVTQNYRNVSTTKNGFAFTDPSFRYLDAASTLQAIGGAGSESTLFSIFGKLDYKFKERYLFSATVRRDASSRFAPSHRWGTFPAFSAGWIISQEEFMLPVTFVTNLKLRAGWGITGNQDIDPYNQYTTYAYSSVNASYPINGGISGASNLFPGYEVRRIGNPDAQWEQQAMTNIGVDVTLFDHLSLTAEWYNRTTSKLLLVVPAPALAGQNQVAAANVGEVSNKGIDLSLNYDGRTNLGLTYGVGVNYSHYTNNVESLYDASNPFISGFLIRQQIFTRTQAGKPLSSFYGMVNEGVFHSQAEADAAPTQFGNRDLYNQAGRLKYKDVNEDGVVDGDDVQFIGNPHPKFTYGVNLNVAYKGLDFTMFLFGQYGNDIYNFQRQGAVLMLYESNKSRDILNYWTPENPTSNIPTPNSTASSEEYYRTSTYFIEKGNYLRAKSMQLGYTLPNFITSKISVDKVRIYFQASNLFTITKYKGTDPEINLLNYNTRGNEIDRGVDRGVYPAAKTFMIGAQIGF